MSLDYEKLLKVEKYISILVNLQNKLGVYGWNHFNSAFATIKEGYVDDDGNYIGYSLMDDIIGSGGKYDRELINKVNALRKKANSQKNYCYNKLCSLQNSSPLTTSFSYNLVIVLSISIPIIFFSFIILISFFV